MITWNREGARTQVQGSREESSPGGLAPPLYFESGYFQMTTVTDRCYMGSGEVGLEPFEGAGGEAIDDTGDIGVLLTH